MNMTIDEMIEELKQYRELGSVEDLRTMKEHGGFTGLELANIATGMSVLNEYRNIGTVEELKSAKEFQDAHKSNPSFIGKRFIDNQTGNIIEVVGEPTGYWQDCACRSTVTGKEFLRPKTYVLANEITDNDAETEHCIQEDSLKEDAMEKE